MDDDERERELRAWLTFSPEELAEQALVRACVKRTKRVHLLPHIIEAINIALSQERSQR